MKKSDKNIERVIVSALTQVCETALVSIDGFSWITHTVNYHQFPDSLVISCVFDNNEAIVLLKQLGEDQHLAELIKETLTKHGVTINKDFSAVYFYTEEQMIRH